MSVVIPPGAFDKSAEHQTRVIKRPDGGDVTAFADTAKSLTKMREAVITHDAALDSIEPRLAAVEGAVDRIPFPFRGSS